MSLPSPFIGRFARFIATFGGCGLSPKAPGTAGTLGALVAPVLLAFFSPASFGQWFGSWFFWAWFLPVWALSHTAVACVLTSERTPNQDPGFIVIDEALGVWLALHLPTALYCLRFSPTEVSSTSWRTLCLLLSGAFLLFRLFDIAKPFPVSWLDQHIKGAAGVILDDLAAGLMAGLILTVLAAYY